MVCVTVVVARTTGLGHCMTAACMALKDSVHMEAVVIVVAYVHRSLAVVA